ncbi:hypothetical protein E1211_27580 [Micromonospora sp. 15K316]|uniref:hypothetical protein n=1 Tax=Micromonospora sp. 15K316 TaxID=2530376 RepID=UPI0010445B0D|nr:hypothetical protein [Micromonospora sp. 15K316]TDC28597.1 hypothetical protein E1211_27580 [Micromonospora sp. 15K316]
MHDREPAADALPYAEVTDDGYAVRAAETFTVREFGPALLLSGDCPRCRHPVTFPVVDHVYRHGSAIPPGDPGYRTVLCTCDAEHPGRPAGPAGCGAYWTLRLEART